MDVMIPNDKFYFDAQGIKTLALKFISIIRARTLRGLDKQGNPFKPYSTKPLAIPSGAITKRAAKELVKSQEAAYFERNGKLWIVIQGGYKAAKAAMKKQTDWDGTVNLSLSGAMLKDLTPLTYDTEGNITIGFASTENAKKARYNRFYGREFLGLTDAEMNAPDVQELILRALKFR